MALETTLTILSIASVVLGMVMTVWGKYTASKAKGEKLKVEEILTAVVIGIDDTKKILTKRNSTAAIKTITAAAADAGVSTDLDDFLEKVGANQE